MSVSDKVFDVPVVVHVRGPDVQKSLELPQMQFCVVVDVLVHMQRSLRCLCRCLKRLCQLVVGVGVHTLVSSVSKTTTTTTTTTTIIQSGEAPF